MFFNAVLFDLAAISAPVKGKSASYHHITWFRCITYEVSSPSDGKCLLTFSFFSDPETKESVTLFHGEDFHILLPSQDVDVTFKNRSDPRKTSVLTKGGKVIGTRAKPTLHLNYINIEAVGEGDEGMYILKDSKDDSVIKQISLIVRGTEQHDTLGMLWKGRSNRTFSAENRKYETHFDLIWFIYFKHVPNKTSNQ